MGKQSGGLRYCDPIERLDFYCTFRPMLRPKSSSVGNLNGIPFSDLQVKKTAGFHVGTT
jgi:hypothetical protein